MLNQAYPLNFQELGIVTRGLVACYDFQGHGNKLIDRSGNGNHGTLGSTAGSDTNDPVWTGRGMQFSGDDWVNCGYFASGLSELTIQAVVIFDSIKKYTSLFHQGWNWVLRTTSTPYVNGILAVNGAAPELVGGSLVTGIPYLITMTYRSNEWKIYLNKTQVALRSDITGSIERLRIEPVLLGGTADGKGGPNSLIGKMYFADLYTRVLYQTEITQNYNAVKQILAQRGVVLP